MAVRSASSSTSNTTTQVDRHQRAAGRLADVDIRMLPGHAWRRVVVGDRDRAAAGRAERGSICILELTVLQDLPWE